MVLAARLACFALALFLFALFGPDFGRAEDWNVRISSSHTEQGEREASDRARIEKHPVCIGSRVWSAGAMADTVYYRARRDGDRLIVGYFVHWTTERPWGNNLLTMAVLPALLVDAFYSHTLFALPGARALLYGPGDVEGASVTYRVLPDGALTPLGAHADDDSHEPIILGASDLDARGKTALVTEVWSHQLGGKQGARYVESAEGAAAMRCFSGASLRPLPREVAEMFQLGTSEAPRRAKPAWRLEGVSP